MKRRIVVTVAMLALVAACGGGSGTSSNDTTPSATSTKSIAADATVMQVGFNAYQQVMAALAGGAMTVKTTSDITFGCTAESNYTGYVCTGTDTSAGTCTATGSATADYMSFTFSLVCNNFHPDSDTMIDGSFDVTVTVHNAAVAMTTKNMNFGKTGDTEEERAECTIDDDDTTYDDGACTEGGTCDANSADLLAAIAFTVGNDGLTLVDACGTYVYGAGFSSTTNLCATQAGMEGGQFIIGFDLQGTFNGENADFAETWTCNYSS